MDKKKELRDRVEAKRKEIEAELLRARADARGAADRQVEKLQKKLDEMKESLKGGWDSISEKAAAKLNDWLK